MSTADGRTEVGYSSSAETQLCSPYLFIQHTNGGAYYAVRAICALLAAIVRYSNENLKIPPEWTAEFKELCDK